MSAGSRLSLHAGPVAGFEQPFEMLAACHERVERMLCLLERLGAHLAARGDDADARQAARDVLRYFDLAGPAHHEDEERHLFPALLARGDPAQRALVRRLQAEHRQMADWWPQVRAPLVALADGHGDVADTARWRSLWAAYAALYRRHIDTEDRVAYPAARTLFDAAALQAMGREMARRRGAPGSS